MDIDPHSLLILIIKIFITKKKKEKKKKKNLHISPTSNVSLIMMIAQVLDIAANAAMLPSALYTYAKLSKGIS